MSPEVPSFSSQENKEQEMSDKRFRPATPEEREAVAAVFTKDSEPIEKGEPYPPRRRKKTLRRAGEDYLTQLERLSGRHIPRT